MLLILHCVFGLLSLFPVQYTVCLGVFLGCNFIFETTYTFSYRLRNIINLPIIPSVFNRPYFRHFFLFKLIHIIYRHDNWFKK